MKAKAKGQNSKYKASLRATGGGKQLLKPPEELMQRILDLIQEDDLDLENPYDTEGLLRQEHDQEDLNEEELEDGRLYTQCTTASGNATFNIVLTQGNSDEEELPFPGRGEPSKNANSEASRLVTSPGTPTTADASDTSLQQESRPGGSTNLAGASRASNNRGILHSAPSANSRMLPPPRREPRNETSNDVAMDDDNDMDFSDQEGAFKHLIC